VPHINELIIRAGASEAGAASICLHMLPEANILFIEVEKTKRTRPQASSFSNPSSFSQGSKNLIDIDMD
jgi:hypothetical protein